MSARRDVAFAKMLSRVQDRDISPSFASQAKTWFDLGWGAVESQTALTVDDLVKCVAAMNEFCDRVESGEVRSKKTYEKFKQLLKR